jgi:hypothetical protein
MYISPVIYGLGLTHRMFYLCHASLSAELLSLARVEYSYVALQ